MKIFKLVLLFVNVIFISACLRAGTWAEEKMNNVINNIISCEEINVDKILSDQTMLALIKENWNIIGGFSFPIGKPPYQVIATLLCNIWSVAHIGNSKDIFWSTENLLIDQKNVEEACKNELYKKETYKEQDYKKEFEYLLDIIQQKATSIDQGLHAIKKAQEAVAYYNDNGEWPYDDYVGGYTVEDFLNEEDPEGVEELKTLEKKEDVKFVSTFVPMSESGSNSIQDSRENSNGASPEKENPQSRIPNMMEMEDQ